MKSNLGYISCTREPPQPMDYQFFPVTRGVRQGCPLAPYLFILAAESLANQIRNNQNIKGINVNGIKHVISLYADDTSLFLVGDATSLKNVYIYLRNLGC